MIIRLEASIFGRVQMVMFRDFVSRKARGLRLHGAVRNMSDGSVAVVAEGEKAAIERLVEHLKRGPVLAKVEHLDVIFKEPSGEYSSFNIIYE